MQRLFLQTPHATSAKERVPITSSRAVRKRSVVVRSARRHAQASRGGEPSNCFGGLPRPQTSLGKIRPLAVENPYKSGCERKDLGIRFPPAGRESARSAIFTYLA